MAADDAAAVARLSKESAQSAAWSVESYRSFPGWVADKHGAVVGFVVVRVAADEMEILNLTVAAGERRQGIGRKFLDAALEFGQRSGAKRTFLEVRESNRAARGLYHGAGFLVVGRRLGFYRDPDEDGLIMAFTMGPRA